MEGRLTRALLGALAVIGVAVWPTPASAAAPTAARQAGDSVALGVLKQLRRAYASSIAGNGLLEVATASADASRSVAGRMAAQFAGIDSIRSATNALPVDARDRLPIVIDSAFDGLLGAVERYRRHSAAAGVNPAIWRNASVMADLRDIGRILAQERESLQTRAIGLGHAAALMLPLALAAEHGAALRAGSDSATIRKTLGRYAHWIRRMTSEVAGSVPTTRAQAERSHDGALGLAAQTHLGRRLQLSHFLMGGNQASERAADPCVIFRKPHVTWRVDARGGVDSMTSRFDSFAQSPNLTSNAVVRFNRVRVRNDDTLGIRRLRLDVGSHAVFPVMTDAGPAFLFWPGLVGEYCYIDVSPNRLAPETAIARTLQIKGVQEDTTARRQILEAIEAANIARSVIATSGDALLLVEWVRARVERFTWQYSQ